MAIFCFGNDQNEFKSNFHFESVFLIVILFPFDSFVPTSIETQKKTHNFKLCG